MTNKMRLIEIDDHKDHIIHNYLIMQNLCAKWVLRELTMETKLLQIASASIYCLDLYCSDFFLFSHLKKMIAGKKLCDSEGLIMRLWPILKLNTSCIKMESKYWNFVITSVLP